MTFIDIGNLVAVKCVKSAQKFGDPVDVCVIGDMGRVMCNLWPAGYSHGEFRAKDFPVKDAVVYGVPSIAFMRQLVSGTPDPKKFCESLKEGDRIDFMDEASSWRVIKAFPNSMYWPVPMDRHWVNAKGESVPEPESFINECALHKVYEVLASGAFASSKFGEREFEQLLAVFADLKKVIRSGKRSE